MIKPRFLFLLLFVSTSGVRADQQVRSTQEELRRRNIFFGDVDGRQSREYEEALKRYQAKKGLTTSGKEDRETLRSLGLATREQGEPMPKDLEWPEEPVLKSDTKIDVMGTAEEISTSTGVSMISLVPNPVATGPRNRQTTDRRRRAVTSQEPQMPAAPSKVKVTGFSLGQNQKLQSELGVFLKDYLRAVSHNKLEDELHFYADRVDYLGNGPVDRRIIEQTLRKYYQHWPDRKTVQQGEIRYRTVPHRGEIVVTFRSEFTLSNGKSKVKGMTENQVVINAATSDPRIVAISEQRVRR